MELTAAKAGKLNRTVPRTDAMPHAGSASFFLRSFWRRELKTALPRPSFHLTFRQQRHHRESEQISGVAHATDRDARSKYGLPVSDSRVLGQSEYSACYCDGLAGHCEGSAVYCKGLVG